MLVYATCILGNNVHKPIFYHNLCTSRMVKVILMTIRYSVFPMQMDDDSTTYYAKVITGKSMTQEELLREMQGLGTTVTTTDMIAVLEALGTVCKRRVLDGFSIKVNKLVTLAPTIQGVFESRSDHFDPKRHKVQVVATADYKMRKEVKQFAKFKKIQVAGNEPSILQYNDFGSDTINQVVTQGGSSKIKGHRLKVDRSRDDESFYFIDFDTKKKFEVTKFLSIMPSEVYFLVPQFDAQTTRVQMQMTTRVRKTRKHPKTSLDGPIYDVAK